MDLMIDCMPLYEMLEDDMRTIANLHCSSSSTSSPSCLSDEEQLALSSCTNMLDDFLFFSTPNNNNTNLPNTPQVAVAPAQNQNNLTYSNLSTVNTSQFNDPDQSRFNSSYNGLNSSFYSSSSSSSCSSSGTSSPLSSASLSSASASPLSLSMSSSSLCAALANTSFTPIQTPSSSTCSSSLSSPVNPNSTNNQFNNNSFSYQVNTSDYSAPYSQPQQPQQQQHQPLNQTNSTSKYMQDSYLNNNYNLYQVINPMDINRTYTITSSNQQSQQVYDNYDNAKSKTILTASSNSLKLPTTVLATRPGDNSIQQQAKRGKYSHAAQPSSASSINNTINSILNETMKLKQEPLNSDGESSIVSNESDSNSNSSSEDNNQNGSSMQPNMSAAAATPKLSHININNINSKKLIITTKLEPFYSSSSSSNVNNLSSNVNTNANQINLIKITNNDDSKATPKKTDNLNHKTIIQYKQLINGGATANTTASLVKPSAQLSTANKTNKNASNPASNETQQQQTNHNGVPLATRPDGKVYPKPPYSYSCLIAMALRNSDSGTLPVSDIYDFIIENFPYYKTARDGWKNSIRHNLSLNKCFEKIENPTNGSKKGCLWALNPDKCKKLEEECKRCRQRDPVNIRLSMSRPDDLNKIERGEQRLKKYPMQNQNQRKLAENSSCQINLTSSLNAITQTSNQNQLINNDTFLIEWTSKNNPEIQEDNDHYFDELGNSDIKFDPILLSTVSPVRANM
jgi:hypothetical protein